MEMLDAITAYDLKKKYAGFTALHGLNLEITRGSVFSIVGSAGCGKTTALRLFAGLCEPTGGECTVLGYSPYHEPRRLHELMGVVTDTTRLYDRMTVNQNLHFYAKLYGIEINDAIDRISFLLHRLDIWEYRDKLVKDLPTNALQKANISRALIHKPKILLLDEPTEGLDMETMLLVRGMIAHIVTEEEATVLITTRHLIHAEALSENYAIMEKGELIARGTLESLRRMSGLKIKAALRLADDSAPPAGFFRKDDLWMKNIQQESEMPALIQKAMQEGCKVYEANIVHPTLENIYDAFLNGIDTLQESEEIYAGEPQDTDDGEPQPAERDETDEGAERTEPEYGDETEEYGDAAAAAGPGDAFEEPGAGQPARGEAEETVFSVVDH